MAARSIKMQTGWRRIRPQAVCMELKIWKKITEYDFDINRSDFIEYFNQRTGVLLQPGTLVNSEVTPYLNAQLQDCWEVFNNTQLCVVTGEVVMAKKKKEEKPAESDASHPSLKYTLIIPNEGTEVKKITTAVRALSNDLLKQSAEKKIRIFMTWEDFFDSCTAEEIKAYAERFGATLKKGMNKCEASLVVWRIICNDAVEMKYANPQKTQTGAPRRQKKLSNRVYVKVADDELTGAELATRNQMTLPPQAKKCLEIFLEEGLDQVPESRMREVIEEKAERLNTKQDPWRIFQYYRPKLIQARWLRLV